MLSPPFYVLSDTHWFHKNIIKYCNRDTNHDSIMVERWNKVVGPDDVVLHLGDLVFTPKSGLQDQFLYQIAPALNGRKYLILGNHDKKSWTKLYGEAGFEVIKPFNIKYREYEVSFDHYPAKTAIRVGDRHIRVHGHIHNSGYNWSGNRKEMKRYGNINVSVEVIDYTPQPIEHLLDKAIDEMKPRQHYVNINGRAAVR